MKKIIFFILVWLTFYGTSLAQHKSIGDPMPHWQGGINASTLIGQLTGVQNPGFARTSPYDLHLRYTGKGRKYFRFDLGYEVPEAEAPSGAIEEGSNKNRTVHFRIGFGWNKRFMNNWVISTGPELIYSRNDEKEFMREELSRHIRINTFGIGGSSNLQYYFTKHFSIGVEMALYNSVRDRNQIYPTDINPQDPFIFFFDGPALQIRLYAPIELFVYYSF